MALLQRILDISFVFQNRAAWDWDGSGLVFGFCKRFLFFASSFYFSAHFFVSLHMLLSRLRLTINGRQKITTWQPLSG
jgi:hypothetical protein